MRASLSLLLSHNHGKNAPLHRVQVRSAWIRSVFSCDQRLTSETCLTKLIGLSQLAQSDCILRRIQKFQAIFIR